MICVHCIQGADFPGFYEKIEVTPHDDCQGCACQHLPAGSVVFLGSDSSGSPE